MRSVPACTCQGPGLTSWSPEVAYGPSLQTTCHFVKNDEDCDESFIFTQQLFCSIEMNSLVKAGDRIHVGENDS